MIRIRFRATSGLTAPTPDRFAKRPLERTVTSGSVLSVLKWVCVRASALGSDILASWAHSRFRRTGPIPPNRLERGERKRPYVRRLPSGDLP